MLPGISGRVFDSTRALAVQRLDFEIRRDVSSSRIVVIVSGIHTYLLKRLNGYAAPSQGTNVNAAYRESRAAAVVTAALSFA